MPLQTALGQHLTSCGFVTLEPNARSNCMFLRADAITSQDMQDTVKKVRQIAKTSPYKVVGVLFKSFNNSVNFIARLQ